MFEILTVIGSILLSVNAVLQFRKTYSERKTLKDLSFAAWMACFIACIFITVRMVEIGEWALVAMETIHGVFDGITCYWIIKCWRKRK